MKNPLENVDSAAARFVTFAKEHAPTLDDDLKRFGDLLYYPLSIPPNSFETDSPDSILVIGHILHEKTLILTSPTLRNAFERIVEHNGYIDQKIWKHNNPHPHSLNLVMNHLNSFMNPFYPNDTFMMNRVFPCGYARRKDHRIRHTLLKNRLHHAYDYRTFIDHEPDIIKFSRHLSFTTGQQVDILVGKTADLQNFLQQTPVEINPEYPYYMIVTSDNSPIKSGQWNEQTWFMEISGDEQAFLRHFTDSENLSIHPHMTQSEQVLDGLLHRLGHFGYHWIEGTGARHNDTIVFPHPTGPFIQSSY